jgi:hypothetical protein
VISKFQDRMLTALGNNKQFVSNAAPKLVARR